MTPQEQRTVLAEWDGWTKAPSQSSPGKEIWVSHDGKPSGLVESMQVPDYLNDLNAVHGLLLKLDDDQWLEFLHNLCDAIGTLTDYSKWMIGRALMSASAAQICEALLKTLGLWREETK